MKKLRYVFTFFLFMAFFFSFTTSYAQGLPASYPSDSAKGTRAEALEKRINQLEPPQPTTIVKAPEEVAAEQFSPSNTIPIADVIEQGTKISFSIIKDDPDYERPVYEEHWHSTYWGGRWSYMPMRIQIALHRLFTTYDIGISGELNFKQNVGIDFPMFHNKKDLDLYIVVFQTEVSGIYTKGNQVIVVGTPKRNGVQVITIKTGDLHPSDTKKLLLLQLATSHGDELDQSLIAYEPPDFWHKRIQKK